jgi:hypothetical protein
LIDIAQIKEKDIVFSKWLCQVKIIFK